MSEAKFLLNLGIAKDFEFVKGVGKVILLDDENMGWETFNHEDEWEEWEEIHDFNEDAEKARKLSYSAVLKNKR